MKRFTMLVSGIVASALVTAACGGSGAGGCPESGESDPSYSATFEEPVGMDESTHVVTVTQDGRPVTGVEVCVSTEMVGMEDMGGTAEAEEVSQGRYEVTLEFEMEGEYRTNVFVSHEDHFVQIPVTLNVS